MVEKLGVSQNYKQYVSKNCQDNEHVKTMAKSLLGETSHTRVAEDKVFLHEPMVLKKLEPFSATLTARFGGTAASDYLVSYRMRKENITYHSTMYLRKGNSCSYIIQWLEHGQVTRVTNIIKTL